MPRRRAVGAAAPAGRLPSPCHGHFRNNYIDFQPKGLADVIKWRLYATAAGLPKRPEAQTPQVDPDLAFVHSNAVAGAAMEPALTWIGHASTLMQAGGLNFLLDPVFTERASPLPFVGPKRHSPPGIGLADLPHIDAVLISHNHYDHLDAAAMRALAQQAGGAPRFVVPLGIGAWFAARGVVDAVELGWWQSTRLGDADVFFTPSQHWSGRTLTDRMQSLWGGFAIFAADFHLLYTGDTAYSRDFADIHARFADRHGGITRGFDLAVVPIGAYDPRWFMRPQHCDPMEAAQIHIDVVATRSVGVHWGTFELSDEALDEPPRALARARRALGLADDVFSTMAIGETRRFPKRPY